MRLISANSFADLYMQVMDQVYSHPDYETAPRGKHIREVINAVLEIKDVTSNLFRCPNDIKVTLATAYLKKEMCLYLSATDSVKEFRKASPFWQQIANPDGKTINSAYGNLIFNKSLKDGRSQFDWAFDCLAADKDSRQAFMRFNGTQHQFDGVRDLPCTYVQSFLVRDNKLHTTVTMRSNDIVRGLAYDVPSFILFQRLMQLRLQATYPDLQLGTYTHVSHSLHLYDTDFEVVERRLKAGLVENRYPLPNDWHVIKSQDISLLKEEKLDKQPMLPNMLSLAANDDFYNWIRS